MFKVTKLKWIKSFMASVAILGITISSSFAAKPTSNFAAKQTFSIQPKKLNHWERLEVAKKFLPFNLPKQFDEIFMDMPKEISDAISTFDINIKILYSNVFCQLMQLVANPIDFISSNFKKAPEALFKKAPEALFKKAPEALFKKAPEALDECDKYDSPIEMLYQKLLELKKLFLQTQSKIDLHLNGDPLNTIQTIKPQNINLRKDLAQRLQFLEKIIYFVGRINDFKKATKEIPLLLFKKAIKKLSVDTLKKVSDNSLLETLKNATKELSQLTLKNATEKLSLKIFTIATEELPLKLLKIAQEDAPREIVEEAYEDLLPEALKKNPDELPLQILQEAIIEYNKKYL